MKIITIYLYKNKKMSKKIGIKCKFILEYGRLLLYYNLCSGQKWNKNQENRLKCKFILEYGRVILYYNHRSGQKWNKKKKQEEYL
ncbi:hypothetical protein ACSG5Z_29200 [Bacillus sp. 'calajunan']